jgi:hypothetical protein
MESSLRPAPSVCGSAGRHGLTQNCFGRPELRDMAQVPLVATPMSRSAMPFEDGEYDINEIIRIPIQASGPLPPTGYLPPPRSSPGDG